MHKREGEKVSNRILYMMTYEGRGDDSGTNRIVLGVMLTMVTGSFTCLDHGGWTPPSVAYNMTESLISNFFYTVVSVK